MASEQKDEFSDLDNDWKESVLSMDKNEINSRIAEIAKNEVENQKAKKKDGHLREARLVVSEAGKGYRDATKDAKLRIQYCMRVLGDRGQE